MSNALPDLEMPELEALRRRIDEIDDRLQDLLIERMEIVSRVADHKQRSGGVAPHQPAREAEILRRLVARNNGGSLPAATLVRIWRELLAATTSMQGAFTVAVYVPQAGPGFWDIARDHYGSHTPMLTFGSAAQVIRTVSEGRATVGVLPMPQEEEADPWWRHLLSSREAAPHVISRLPFGGRGNARPNSGDALAIGRGAQLPTGRDRTLIATENAPNISRGRLFSNLSALDLRCTFIALSEHAEGGSTLIELDGFVAVDDPRLDRFRAQLGPAVYRLLPLGGYAVPLSAAELSPVGLMPVGSTGVSGSSAAAAGTAARG